MSLNDTNSTINNAGATIDPLESVLVGVAYIIVSVAYIVPYLACIFVMHTDSGMSSSPLFHIVRHMGYCDVAQLALNGLPAGLFSILRTDRPFLLNKILGAVLDAMWFVYVFLAQALAINRFVHMKTITLAVRTTEDDKEKKLLLQACLLCFSDVLAVAAYMILQHMPALIGHLLPIFINYTWIMCAGSNVIVYLFLNSKIKNRIWLMVFRGQFKPPPSTRKPTVTKAVRPNQSGKRDGRGKGMVGERAHNRGMGCPTEHYFFDSPTTRIWADAKMTSEDDERDTANSFYCMRREKIDPADNVLLSFIFDSYSSS
uniref:Vomeronasal type-1 receptor n=1 Tax=Romanomermis culicivorax TaxID=13658 RepID=A0A915KJD9_ROMCU